MNEWRCESRENWIFDSNHWNTSKRYYGVNDTSTFYYRKGRKEFNCSTLLRIDFNQHGTIVGRSIASEHSQICNEGYNQRNISHSSVFSSFELRKKSKK